MKKQRILQIWMIVITNLLVYHNNLAQVVTIETDKLLDLNIRTTIKVKDSIYFIGHNAYPNYVFLTKTDTSFQGFMQNMKHFERKGHNIRLLDVVTLDNGNFMLLGYCTTYGVKRDWKIDEEKRGLIMVIDKDGNLLYEHLYLGYDPHSLKKLGKNVLLFIYRMESFEAIYQQLYTILLDMNGKMIRENLISDVCKRDIFPLCDLDLQAYYTGTLEANNKTPQTFNCSSQTDKLFASHFIQIDSLGMVSKKKIIPTNMPSNINNKDGSYFVARDGFIYVFTPYKPKDEFFTPQVQREFDNLQKGKIPFQKVKAYITKVNPENFTTIASFETEISAMPYWVADLNDRKLSKSLNQEDYLYRFAYYILLADFLNNSFFFIHEDKYHEKVYFQEIDLRGKILAQKKVDMEESFKKELEIILKHPISKEKYYRADNYSIIEKDAFIFLSRSTIYYKDNKERYFLQFFILKMDRI
ncbi:MAG: hypothetical protein MUE81_10410 [Thermoflexibacter sp.]|jgi:hypothetical protein|nr:hypothetical protein [Thermoflexibacter sp.]